MQIYGSKKSLWMESSWVKSIWLQEKFVTQKLSTHNFFLKPYTFHPGTLETLHPQFFLAAIYFSPRNSPPTFFFCSHILFTQKLSTHKLFLKPYTFHPGTLHPFLAAICFSPRNYPPTNFSCSHILLGGEFLGEKYMVSRKVCGWRVSG